MVSAIFPFQVARCPQIVTSKHASQSVCNCPRRCATATWPDCRQCACFRTIWHKWFAQLWCERIKDKTVHNKGILDCANTNTRDPSIFSIFQKDPKTIIADQEISVSEHLCQKKSHKGCTWILYKTAKVDDSQHDDPTAEQRTLFVIFNDELSTVMLKFHVE